MIYILQMVEERNRRNFDVELFNKTYREKDDIKRLLEIFERRKCPIYTLHTSGHADSDAIQKLIDTVKPKEIKYVHKREFFGLYAAK